MPATNVAVTTPEVHRRRCPECKRAFEQPVRQAMPRTTCSPECKLIRRRRQNREAQRRHLERQELRYLRATDLPDRQDAGPHFALEPRELVKLLELHASGWAVVALARRFGVSVRTVQRALRLGRPVRVQVGDYSAWFAAQLEGPPVQLSGWHRQLQEAAG